MRATLHTDGGARGNPGPAGIGYVLKIVGGRVIEHGEYVGKRTNNQAEYMALVAGVKMALKEGVKELHCFLDSELIVKQLTGKYRIKDKNLQLLAKEVNEAVSGMGKLIFTHVPREKNKRADKLVNMAINKNAT